MWQGHAVSGDFTKALINFVKSGEAFEEKVYADSTGVPTIGFGYAMILYRGRGDAKKYYVNPELENDFDGIHDFTAVERRLLKSIADQLTLKDVPAAKVLLRDREEGLLNFTVSEPGAQDLFWTSLIGKSNQPVWADSLPTVGLMQQKS